MSILLGDRLDSIAATHLGDPLQFWQVCDANNTMNPFDLVGQDLELEATFPGFHLATGSHDAFGLRGLLSSQARLPERNFQVVDAAEAIAAEHGATVPQVALAWLLGVEGVTAPILGARTYEHLEDALGCLEVELSAEERARLEAPAPPPVVYPQRMLVEQSGMERLTPPLRRPTSTAAG